MPPKKKVPAGKTTGCAMLVPGYGILRLHATAVMFGINIVATETESRHGKAMNVAAKTSGGFTLDLAFYNRAEYLLFSRVILHYGNNVTRGIVGSPCRVMIPSIIDSKSGKSFDRVGIPESPAPFGEDVTIIAPKVSMRFMGTSDPYSPVGVKDIGLVSNVIGSEYLNSIKRDPQSAYYYPSGSQLSGKNYGVDTLYDSVPGESAFEEVEEPTSAAERERRSTRGGRREF